MNRTNKTIISIVSVAIAVVICFFGYNFYQKKQAEVVSAEKLTAIHEVIKKFNDGNDRNERLNLLKDTLDEQSKYNLNSYKDSKVQDEYKNSITTMRTYFQNDYDSTIKTNTLSDVSAVSDEKVITDNKTKLDELTKTIDKEKDITFETEQQAQNKQSEIEKLIKDFFFNSYKYDSSNVSSLVDKLFILPRDNKLDVPLYNIEEIKIPLYEWWYNHILKDFYDTFNTDIEITNEELVIFGALMSLVNPDGTFTPYNSDDITNIPKSLLNEKIVTFDISYIKDKNLRLTLDGKPLSNPEVDMLDVSLSAIRYKREKNK